MEYFNCPKCGLNALEKSLSEEGTEYRCKECGDFFLVPNPKKR